MDPRSKKISNSEIILTYIIYYTNYIQLKIGTTIIISPRFCAVAQETQKLAKYTLESTYTINNCSIHAIVNTKY